MSATRTWTLTDRIAWILQWYLNRINFEAQRDHTADPQVGAVWQRMYRLIRRLTALAAKFQTGTLPPHRARRPRATARTEPATPRVRPPRASNWLCRQFPDTMPPLGGAVSSLCNDPEIMALVAAAPQAGRILRPMCQMIGLEPPPYLQLPRRPRRPRPAAKPRPPRPVNVDRLSSVAFGNLINPEREPMGWRPPNRIGYARPRPPPKRE